MWRTVFISVVTLPILTALTLLKLAVASIKTDLEKAGWNPAR
jgi:hypothetical protein